MFVVVERCGYHLDGSVVVVIAFLCRLIMSHTHTHTPFLHSCAGRSVCAKKRRENVFAWRWKFPRTIACVARHRRYTNSNDAFIWIFIRKNTETIYERKHQTCIYSVTHTVCTRQIHFVEFMLHSIHSITQNSHQHISIHGHRLMLLLPPLLLLLSHIIIKVPKSTSSTFNFASPLPTPPLPPSSSSPFFFGLFVCTSRAKWWPLGLNKPCSKWEMNSRWVVITVNEKQVNKTHAHTTAEEVCTMEWISKYTTWCGMYYKVERQNNNQKTEKTEKRVKEEEERKKSRSSCSLNSVNNEQTT